MPTSTLRTTKPAPFEQCPHGYIVSAGENIYWLAADGLKLARIGNFAWRKTSLSPDGRRWAENTGAGTTITIRPNDFNPPGSWGSVTVALPATAGAPVEHRWSPGSGSRGYVAAAHGTTPFVSIYNVETATKLSNPATLPAGNAQSVAWSPDGEYLAVAHATSPYLTVYQRTRTPTGVDDVFTKLANPGTLPNATGQGVCFSPVAPNGRRYLVVATTSGGANSLVLYSVDGTTITHRQTVAILDEMQAVAWSPSGQYVAVAGSTTGGFGRFRLYTVANDTLTLQQSIFGGAGTTFFATAWTPDEKYLLLARDDTPFLEVYVVRGNAATIQVHPTNPSSLPTVGNVQLDCVAWHVPHKQRTGALG